MNVQVDVRLDEVNVNEYDTIIFIGGIGACRYYKDLQALFFGSLRI